MFLAEAVRFELTEGSHPRRFSRPVHSTALPSFRARNYNHKPFGLKTSRANISEYSSAFQTHALFHGLHTHISQHRNGWNGHSNRQIG